MPRGRPRKYADRTEVRNAHWRIWLNEKKSGPCSDCGNRFPPECMDFDHRSSEVKLFNIATSFNKSQDSLAAEIAKCDLVCANCHRIRTHMRRAWAQMDNG